MHSSMKLREIVAVPQQDQHNIRDMSVFDNVVQYHRVQVEKYPLLYNEDANAYYFCIEENNNKIAFIVAEKNSFNNKQCIIIRRTWVNPSYRNKGFMKAMYNTLHNCGFVVLSDVELSPESISIWKALAISRNVKIIDTNTEEIRDIVPDDYTTANMNTQFILEARYFNTRTNMSGMLQEYQHFINNRYKEIL